MSTNDYTPGWWINHGTGSLIGLTLTLSTRDGGILISFLTIFIRFVGSSTWGICRFALHQYRSSRDPQDGLFHQQQVTLRNASQLGTALWSFVSIAWAWKSHAKRPLIRSTSIVSLIVFQLIAFTVAGLLTSRIIASSNEVLYPVGVCGYWQTFNDTSYDQYNAQTVNAHGITYDSNDYVQNCYNGMKRTASSECAQYVQQNIESTIQTNVSCPFADPATCIYQDYNIRLDTGYIDSNAQLGVNAPRGHSIGYRKTTTCTVVNSTKWLSGYTSDLWNTNYVKGPADILPGDSSIYYQFGHGFDYQGNDDGLDYIFSVSNYSRYSPSEAYSITILESVLDFPGGGGGSAFVPNNNFTEQVDQDLQLIFLVNSASYTDKVADAWYSAHSEVNTDTNLGVNYVSDYPASVMGCFEQHQICSKKPSGSMDKSPDCTPLTGRSALNNSLTQDSGASIGLNKWQWATANRLLQNIDEMTIRATILELGPSVLHAQAYLDWQTEDFTSNPVVDDEWMIEAANWHNITLVNLQAYMVAYAAGPWYEPLQKYVREPSTEEERDMCSQQRTRSLQAMSFSGIGVLVIIVVGSAIVGINLCLPTAAGLIQKVLRKGAHRHQEWVLDEVLQLQRVAYQRAGQGTWSKTESKVLLCESGEKFRHSRHFGDKPHTLSSSPTEVSPYAMEITEYVALKS